MFVPFIFSILYFPFPFSSFFPTAPNIRVLPWSPECTPSCSLEPSKINLFFALTVIYIFLWSVTHIDKEPSISYRLMITHNGHSRTISFRSSCDYLNKFYSSTITAPSRLCHLQFYRNRQYTSPVNKHGQDSGDFTTS